MHFPRFGAIGEIRRPDASLDPIRKIAKQSNLMKPLKPASIFKLNHRAHFFSGWAGRSTFIAASSNGHLSVIDLESNKVRETRLAEKLKAISLHPKRPLLVWADGKSGSAVVQSLSGQSIAEMRQPEAASESALEADGSNGFNECYFDETGDFLWLVAPISGDECEVLLVETSGWTTVQRTAVEDPFGESSFSFHPVGRPDRVCLWIAGGQDGQSIYWVDRVGSSFSVTEVDELSNCTPPALSPDGSEFLVLTEDNAIRRYNFEPMKPLGSPASSEDEENPFVESLCYIDDQHALASSNSGRVFMLDVKQLEVEDEVAVEGHEPRPVCEYYPKLKDESELATDIAWFNKVGGIVIFICRYDGGTGLNGWKDSLLCYSPEK